MSPRPTTAELRLRRLHKTGGALDAARVRAHAARGTPAEDDAAERLRAALRALTFEMAECLRVHGLLDPEDRAS